MAAAAVECQNLLGDEDVAVGSSAPDHVFLSLEETGLRTYTYVYVQATDCYGDLYEDFIDEDDYGDPMCLDLY